MLSFWEYIKENLLVENKKIENKDSHADRYFGQNSEAVAKEIDGKGSEPSVGRGLKWSKKSKPSSADFNNSSFTHKDGRKLIPTSANPVKKDGKWHQQFHTSDGKVEEHPIQHVETETKDTGKHNDEHALKGVWNHFTQGKHREHIKQLLDQHGENAHDHIVDYIHKHIDHAEKNGKHFKNGKLVDFSESDKTEFVHNKHGHGDGASEVVKNRAKSSYYQNCRDSALSLAGMVTSKEYRKHFDEDHEIVPTGSKKGKLNENARNFGMKDGSSSATYKSDVMTFKRRGKTPEKDKKRIKILGRNTPKDVEKENSEGVSVKKAGGSQIESPDARGFSAMYHHAIEKHCDEHGIDDETRAKAHRLREQIGGSYKDGELVKPGHMHKGEQELASKKLSQLHNLLDNHPNVKQINESKKTLKKPKKSSFTRRVWHSGITGDFKFEGNEGRASSILIQGKTGKKARKRAKIMSVPRYLDHLEEKGQLRVPEVAGSKHPKKGQNSLSLRMRVND